jgi:hypothetical protein
MRRRKWEEEKKNKKKQSECQCGSGNVGSSSNRWEMGAVSHLSCNDGDRASVQRLSRPTRPNRAEG